MSESSRAAGHPGIDSSDCNDMPAQINTAYISVGANRSSSCSACTSSGLLAYGAGRLVALWNADPSSSKGVHATLPGHFGVVTTLKLFQNDMEGKQAAFISGDASGNVRVWKRSKHDEQLQCSLSFDAHPKASISAIAVCPAGPLSDHILTGASDGAIKLWRLGDGQAELVQTIDLKGRLPLDMEISALPGSTEPVLVLGCTDRRIQIYTLRNSRLTQSISLEGHEDWVRCLAITPYPSSSSSETTDLLLASGSQDNYIRLWRISGVMEQGVEKTNGEAKNGYTTNVDGAGSNGLDMLDEFERKLAGEAGGNVQISTKAHVLSVGEGKDLREQRYNITLEALLIGHENGITNLHWSPTSSPHLLSTASDNSLIIWTPSSSPSDSLSDESDGIWIPAHRFGALGGRGLSFFGALWGPSAKSVLASGWNGGWERWVLGGNGEGWEPKVGLNGHWEDVKDIQWSPSGEYLLSVSSDQTTRIHAPTHLEAGSRWAEIARPQVHGYDLTCATWISDYRFASGADEKVTRVFDAPGGFVESLSSLGVLKDSKGVEAGERPKGATVPPLGLSNRALGRAVDATMIPTSHTSQDSVSRAMTALPTEEELATSTLWPEIEKVYGHGYELVSMASSHSGHILATACRATTAEHASVRLISTSSWDTIAVLPGHSLTVTRIQFSADDKRILTCSRDRGWRVYEHSPEAVEKGEDDMGGKEADGGWNLVASEEKAHARMILDACWLSGDKGFVTAGRDKMVKIWSPSQQNDKEWQLSTSIKLLEGASAVDVASIEEREVLAVGTETGSVALYDLVSSESQKETKLLKNFDPNIAHAQAVTRLAFRPNQGEKREGLELAGCSEDRSVRVWTITLE